MSIATNIKKTARAILAKENEADILDSLKEDHEQVDQLLKKLVASESATERKSLLRQIKAALVPHVRAEEKIVYDAVLKQTEKEARQDGEEGYIEHHLVDKILADMGRLDNAASPEFAASAKVLKELVEHHVKDEEKNIWADVRKFFSSDERMEMNARFEAAKKTVKVPN